MGLTVLSGFVEVRIHLFIRDDQFEVVFEQIDILRHEFELIRVEDDSWGIVGGR